jgi:imidazole glycerol-phosphate synthase subunit HisH
MTSVGIVDYGSGNLLSVTRAFEHCGARPVLVSTPEGVRDADRLVLPGVGAFADGMNGLRTGGLADAVRAYASSGRPMLGICLGMQMLATESEEFGSHPGLQLIAGRVVRMPGTSIAGEPQKVPSIGWCELQEPVPGRWRGRMMDGFAAHTAVYLVHSYQFIPENPEHQLAVYSFGGHRITAAVQAGNIIGCQFHPEKSGPVGLRMLSFFMTL